MKAKIFEMIQAVPPPGMVRITVDGQVRFLTPLAAKVLRNELIRVWPEANLTGRRFGRLVVLERNRHMRGHWTWLCKRDCGKQAVKVGYNLTSGGTKSCGCLRTQDPGLRQRNGKARRKH